jgi:hypothetical protein
MAYLLYRISFINIHSNKNTVKKKCVTLVEYSEKNICFCIKKELVICEYKIVLVVKNRNSVTEETRDVIMTGSTQINSFFCHFAVNQTKGYFFLMG